MGKLPMEKEDQDDQADEEEKGQNVIRCNPSHILRNYVIVPARCRASARKCVRLACPESIKTPYTRNELVMGIDEEILYPKI